MNKLYRSRDNRVIAGVCAGLAERFDLNATGVRWIVALASLFFTGVPVIVYIVLAIVLKLRPAAEDDVIDV